MKKIKKLITVLAAAAAMILLPGAFTITASAEEPNTFILNYSTEDGWYMILDEEKYLENPPHKVMDAFFLGVKDGDIVVVYNSVEDAPLLDLRDLHLSNLTVSANVFTMISVGSVDECIFLQSTKCSLTGQVNYAFIFDPCLVNFNSNVQTIDIQVPETNCESTVGCSGTVGSMRVLFGNNSSYTMYNFKPDTLYFEEGSLKTAQGNFTMTPPAATPAPAPTSAPQAPGGSSGEYDKVPKTGESNAFVWLLAAALLCTAVSLEAKRAAR